MTNSLQVDREGGKREVTSEGEVFVRFFFFFFFNLDRTYKHEPGGGPFSILEAT